MRKFLLLFCTFFLCFFLSAQRTIIWCGALINGTDNDAKPNMTVIVQGNKIVSVEKGFATSAAGDKVVDLKNATVTPGWMDMHVHLSEETSPTRYIDAFQLNEADYAYKS